MEQRAREESGLWFLFCFLGFSELNEVLVGSPGLIKFFFFFFECFNEANYQLPFSLGLLSYF